MRDCFGDGRLVRLEDGDFAIEALGLHQPARLLPSADGATAVPDLSEQIGKVVSFAGMLELIGGKQTQERCRLHIADLQLPEAELPVTPMWGVFTGNLGTDPELRNESRWNAPIAYGGSGEDGSWLRLTMNAYFGQADLFSKLKTGEAIMACGAFESYVYNGKERLQLSLRRWQHMPRGSKAPKPPTVLVAAASAADVAADPFVDG